METLTGLRSWGRVPVKVVASKKMPRYPVSPKGVLLMTKFNYDLFKVSKMTIFNYEFFKASNMTC